MEIMFYTVLLYGFIIFDESRKSHFLYVANVNVLISLVKDIMGFF